MMASNLEQELKSFDYSVFSNVRESLLQDLLRKHRRDNGMRIQSLSQKLMARHMTEDDLDYVVAAGNPHWDAGNDRRKDVGK